MAHTLPELPYPKDALAPAISAETLEYHHDKHHAAYVAKLNELVAGTEFEDAPLEDVVKKASGPTFNQAAQIWNHTFYFRCMKPGGPAAPSGALAAALDSAFGSLDGFKERFATAAVGLFGSGWAWLVQESGGGLAIVQASNAGNPMTEQKNPLLTCDVWEHAYYIDYRNLRPKYVEAFLGLVDWGFVAANLK
jgi:Fe-Mn family superoxide dismutase